jgi:uncharacterized membrane protein YfcA
MGYILISTVSRLGNGACRHSVLCPLLLQRFRPLVEYREWEQELGVYQMVWRTVAAVLVALIVSTIVAALATTIGSYLFAMLPQWIPHPELAAWAIGGFLGIYSAQWACDKLLREYFGRAVFIVILLIVAAAAFGALIGGVTTKDAYRLIQMGVVLLTAWQAFWKGAKLHEE